MAWRALGLVGLLSLFCVGPSEAAVVRRTVDSAAAAAAAAAAVVTTAAASSTVERAHNFTITMKTLLLSMDPVMSSLPRTVMTAYGQPFTILELVENGAVTDPTAAFLSNLTDADGNPQYNSVVLASSNLGYQQPNGTWASALTPEQWQVLYEYCARYGARIVSLSSTYVVDEGMYPAPGFEKGMTGDAYISFIDSNFTDTLLGNVRKGAVFKVGQVSEFVMTSYWWAPALVHDNATHIKPFLYINPVDPIENPACNDSASTISLQGADCLVTQPNWVGAVVREAEGREEMHFFINSNEFGHHGFVLGDVWMQWAVRGTWLGQRRMHLDTQIDDVFLSTRVYNVTADRPGYEGEPAYRSSTSDFRQLRDYVISVNNRMGPGSRYVTQMAFNGIGYFNNEYNVDDMNDHLREFRDDFFWLSHTWSHLDLYCYNSNCESYGRTRANDTLWDLMKNVWFAETVLYDNVPPEHIDTWPTYSRHGLVTPRISGLNLSDSVTAMSSASINNTVGDNSRRDLTPINPYHAFPSTGRDQNNNSVLVIPRISTRAYFDCSTAEENSKEHASMYGPECYGHNYTGEVSYPYKCNVLSFKYPRQLTYDEILSIESFESARYLLAWRHDPYMFHQANLRFFEHHGRNQSLLTIWVDRVLDYVANYTTVPLVTYKMDDLQFHYRQRMERDACGLVGKIEYKDGHPVKYILSAEANCTAKLSRVLEADDSDPWQITAPGEEEHYARDRTRSIPLEAGQVIELPLGEPATLAVVPDLPYPLLSEVDIVLMNNYSAGMTADRYEMFVVGNMTAVEKQMKETLVSDVAEAVELHKPLATAECLDGGDGQMALDKAVQRADSLYYYLALPAKDARQSDTWPSDIDPSWYLRMEDVANNVSAMLLADAQTALPNDTEQITKAVEGHRSQVVDRLENHATVYFRLRFKAYLALKSRYNGLPNCADGRESPLSIEEVTVFPDPLGSVGDAAASPLKARGLL